MADDEVSIFPILRALRALCGSCSATLESVGQFHSVTSHGIATDVTDEYVIPRTVDAVADTGIDRFKNKSVQSVAICYTNDSAFC